jgi:hypothetical protein
VIHLQPMLATSFVLYLPYMCTVKGIL